MVLTKIKLFIEWKIKKTLKIEKKATKSRQRLKTEKI